MLQRLGDVTDDEALHSLGTKAGKQPNFKVWRWSVFPEAGAAAGSVSNFEDRMSTAEVVF